LQFAGLTRRKNSSIAAGVQRAVGPYGTDYGASITGLDREIAWAQVSNTEVFLYIPYSFTVSK
jgi:hypothetical protein